MKIKDLIEYAVERGAAFVKGGNGLLLRDPEKLTELHRKVLYRRRAEVYQHLRVEMPDAETCPLETCPSCGKSLLDKDVTNDGF